MYVCTSVSVYRVATYVCVSVCSVYVLARTCACAQVCSIWVCVHAYVTGSVKTIYISMYVLGPS